MNLKMLHLIIILVSALYCDSLSTEQLNQQFVSATSRFNAFKSHCLISQQKIISELENEDGNKFSQDPWQKLDSKNELVGFGVTAVIQGGNLIEKGAVSTTFSNGILSAERASSMSSKFGRKSATEGKPYYAAALSLVLHSKSPMIPTFRADIRYFELENGESWFGGGADLTPYYLFDEDAKYFHQFYKNICDKYSTNTLYYQLKENCDKYFYIPARGEHRGIGGIFFDDLSSIDSDALNSSDNLDYKLDDVMLFCNEVSDNFMKSYLPICTKRKNIAYSPHQRHWQLLRRGRYIEFNMLYDRGVKFGLVPGGRIEAVMVSCPPLVAWDYNHQIIPNSEEDRLMNILKNPVQWAS